MEGSELGVLGRRRWSLEESLRMPSLTSGSIETDDPILVIQFLSSSP